MHLLATRQIAAMRGLERVRILILTTYDTDAYVFEALQAGASSFLLQDSGPAELLHTIRVVAAGEALLAPRITRRLIAQFTAARTAHQAAEDRPAVLTQREREVLALVGEGLSNSEVAERLVLSPAMARTHVSRAMVKLGARDHAQLVVVAYQTGLVSPGPPACPRSGPEPPPRRTSRCTAPLGGHPPVPVGSTRSGVGQPDLHLAVAHPGEVGRLRRRGRAV